MGIDYEATSAFLIGLALAVLLLFACAAACVVREDRDHDGGPSLGE
jgi:hypothetical protein